MSDDTAMVQWSISLPPRAQYAKGDMLNVKGSTAAEVEAEFDSILNGDFLEKATSVGNLLYQAFLVAEGLGHTAPAADSGATVTQQGDTALPGGGSFCEHGKREWKTGNGNRGPWKGWFCPQNVKSCKPEWVNDK